MRLVVVTGGAKGIGRAVVQRFAADGDDVVAVGRDEHALAAVAGGSVSGRICDVTDESAVIHLFDEIGPVDVLVNSAGTSSSAPLPRTTLADWRQHLEVNATGCFLCTRAVLSGMLARDRGRIVTVASTAALTGSLYTAAYAASKHAAVGLMRAVAAEVAGTGVTVNAVCPAFVRGEMTDRSVARIVRRTSRTSGQVVEALGALSGLGRLLEPEEVAAAVYFLASREAAAINGDALVLDGGPQP